MPGQLQPNVGIYQGYADLEDGWGDELNLSLRALDALVQARVIDKDLNTPPGSPSIGDTYIVGPSPTGLWGGQANRIARWQAPVSPDTLPVAGWEFYIPKAGWQVWVTDEARPYRFLTAWVGLETPTINDQTGTSYTLAISDAGGRVGLSNAGAITLTVPSNASIAFPIGYQFAIRQAGAGRVTISPAGGVTLNLRADGTLFTLRQGGSIILRKVATDTWEVTPDFLGPLIPSRDDAGTAVTLAIADMASKVRHTAATAVEVTVPTNASVAIPVGAVFSFRQIGSGKVTLTPAGGVTLNIPTGYTAATGRVGAEIMAHKVATDAWDVTGDLST